jgi:hypothetical protein
MKFLIIFHVDRQIVEVPASSVISGKYEGYSEQDWLNEMKPTTVTVNYEDEHYEATVLQVVYDDAEDLSNLVDELRKIRDRKQSHLRTLLSSVPRVATGRRSRIKPMHVRLVLRFVDAMTCMQ